MEPGFSPVFQGKRELKSAFCVEPVTDRTDRLALIFKSSGANLRRDYNEALDLILQRLVRMRAVIELIDVDSMTAQKLAKPKRKIKVEGYRYPIQLANVGEEDALNLRKKIGAGASQVARALNAKPGGGNPQKRLRFVLSFATKRTPRPQTVRKRLEADPGYATSSSNSGSSGSRDSGTSTPKKNRRKSRSGGGAGRQIDPVIKKAVEEYAMQVALDHYEQDTDWTPKRRDHKRGLGYDILCTRGRRRLYVEVKGSTGLSGVHLTANEVKHAHAHAASSVLFVVDNIEVDPKPSKPHCAGGRVRIYEDWDPHAAGKLKIESYTYEPPPKPAQRYLVED